MVAPVSRGQERQALLGSFPARLGVRLTSSFTYSERQTTAIGTGLHFAHVHRSRLQCVKRSLYMARDLASQSALLYLDLALLRAEAAPSLGCSPEK